MKFKFATMAAAMLVATGAQAADLGVPAPAAVDYVKVCDAYGTGFFYIPGTETCLKIDGYVRADYRAGWSDAFFVAGRARAYIGPYGGGRPRDNIFSRARALLHFDARTNTEFGLLRSYIEAYWTVNSRSGGSNVATTLDQAFIQFAGLTAGRAQSFFDFNTGYAMGMLWHGLWGDSKTNLLAYTFSFGNGISASLSLEDPTTSAATNGRRVGTTTFAYQGLKAPDVVGQLRISQAWGSAQLSGVAHHIYGTTGRNIDTWGWGVGAGVEVNLPMIAPGDKAFLQAFYTDGAIGYGCGNCVRVLTTIGGDAVASAGGRLRTTEALSVTGGFKHNFSSMWEANIDGGWATVDGFGARDYDQVEIAADLRWKPVSGLMIGAAVEYRSVDWSNATTRAFNLPGRQNGLKDADALMVGLRVQRSF